MPKMKWSHTFALAVASLLALPAVADEAQTFTPKRVRLSFARGNNQPVDSNRFFVAGRLPTSEALTALDLPAAEFEVRFGDVTAFHIAKNSAGKLVKRTRSGAWRMRAGRYRLRLDPATGAFRIANRRADLAVLRTAGAADVPVSVRFDDLEFVTTVSFKERGKSWRYRAPRD
jgi:hypothetical protein